MWAAEIGSIPQKVDNKLLHVTDPAQKQDAQSLGAHFPHLEALSFCPVALLYCWQISPK